MMEGLLEPSAAEEEERSKEKATSGYIPWIRADRGVAGIGIGRLLEVSSKQSGLFTKAKIGLSLNSEMQFGTLIAKADELGLQSISLLASSSEILGYLRRTVLRCSSR
jgi:hypothetical protein